MGDGAPEGLPLNYRFFLNHHPVFDIPPPAGEGRVMAKLTPSCDGEPLSSSSFILTILKGHALSFPYLLNCHFTSSKRDIFKPIHWS